MQKIFNIFLFISFIFFLIVIGFFTLLNLNAHNKYVERIIDHKDFKEYIVIDSENENLKYDNYTIWVNKRDDMQISPIEKSGIEKGELAWAYTIEIKVNEKFAELSKADQLDIAQELSHYLKGQKIGIGPIHKGFYHYLSIYYDNPEGPINEGYRTSFYKNLDLDVHQPNNINGLTKKEWLTED